MRFYNKYIYIWIWHLISQLMSCKVKSLKLKSFLWNIYIFNIGKDSNTILYYVNQRVINYIEVNGQKILKLDLMIEDFMSL